MRTRKSKVGEEQFASGARTGSPARSTALAVQMLREHRGAQVSAQDVLALQRSAGNAAVQRMIAGSRSTTGTPVTVQRWSPLKAVKTAARAGKFIGMWPINRVQIAIQNLKRGRQRAADRKVIEDIAAEAHYEDLVSGPAWSRDRAAIKRIEDRINQEAIDRGLTINF